MKPCSVQLSRVPEESAPEKQIFQESAQKKESPRQVEIVCIDLLDSSSDEEVVVVKKRPLQEDQKLMCDVCDRQFKKRKWLQNHLVAEHGIKEASDDLCCHICSKSYATPKKLHDHVNSIHSTRPVMCQK